MDLLISTPAGMFLIPVPLSATVKVTAVPFFSLTETVIYVALASIELVNKILSIFKKLPAAKLARYILSKYSLSFILTTTLRIDVSLRWLLIESLPLS